MTAQTLFQREIHIAAPVEQVWQLVATEAGLRQWWGNTIYLEAKEGGRCEEWRANRQGMVQWQGVVTRYEPPHTLMLTLRQTTTKDAPALTTIAITLEAHGDQTLVHVSQRAFGVEPATAIPDSVSTPRKPQGVPLAQLDQPAPGALPMPATVPQTGMIDPAYMLQSRQQAELLRLTWEQRLGALLAQVHTQ